MPNGKKYYALGIAAICYAIWRTRNKTCFEDKYIQHPAAIICYAYVLMSYWTGLYPEEEKVLEAGMNTMLKIVIKLLEAANIGQQLMQDTGDDD